MWEYVFSLLLQAILQTLQSPPTLLAPLEISPKRKRISEIMRDITGTYRISNGARVTEVEGRWGPFPLLRNLGPFLFVDSAPSNWSFSLGTIGAQFVGHRKGNEVAEHTDDQAAYSHRRPQQVVPYQHAGDTGHNTS